MPNIITSRVIEDLSIDCLIFGFHDARLQVLLVKHGEGIVKGKWGLPGGFILADEGIDDSAYRILKATTGVENIYLEQLQAFGNVDRYPGKRVVTLAYIAMIRPENYKLVPGFTAAEAQWFELIDVPKLIFDHNEMLSYGVQSIQHKVRHEPIGFNLLPEKFTLLQLQELYEATLGIKLDKPNFRRKMLRMKLLLECNEKEKNVAHRAAKLYRFDEERYQELLETGFNFEL